MLGAEEDGALAGGGWRPGGGRRLGAGEEAALVACGRWRRGAEVERVLAGAGRPGRRWTVVTHRKALYEITRGDI